MKNIPLFENFQEKVIIDYYQEDNFDEDIDNEQILDDCYDIAKKCEIRIASDEELMCYASIDNEIVGCLFRSMNEDYYYISVVIKNESQKKGIGRKLVSAAISEYKENLEIFEDMILAADCVNDNMVKLLSTMGFTRNEERRGHVEMIYQS